MHGGPRHMGSHHLCDIGYGITGVVETGYDRHTHDQRDAAGGYLSEVAEDGLVGAPGLGPMDARIDVLDVEVDQVHIRQQSAQCFRIAQSRGIQAGMNARLVGAAQDLQSKLGLGQDLAPGEGDPTTGVLIEVKVAADHGSYFVRRHLLATEAHGVVRARLHTVAAGGAHVTVDDDAVGSHADGPQGAGLYAAIAAFAERLAMHEFRLRALGLRVGAPHAAERAALEEDGSADARTIVDAVPLDVENGPGNGCHCRSLLVHVVREPPERRRRWRRRSGVKRCLFATPLRA